MLTNRSTGQSMLLLLATSAVLGLLGGCGGGGVGSGGTGGPGAGAGTGTAVTAAPTMTLTLTDPATGVARTSVSSGSPATVTATLKSSSGAAVPNAVVTFTTDATLGTFTPTSGTALTSATGVATVTVNAASIAAAGAATLTATSQVVETSGGTRTTTAVTASLGYAVGAASVTILTPPGLTFGTNPLSSYGTTSVSVTVLVAGVPTAIPLTVGFSSPCASSGKAVLTASVATVGGVATASYRDNGCAGSDPVTATVSGVAVAASSTLTVTAPSTGSIQFVSAVPTSITLKGTGGFGRQESAQVTFRVVDTGGNPIGGKGVNLSLSTAAGGITLSPSCPPPALPCATSDPTTGQVVAQVQAGIVSTPVRVTASTVSGGTTLTTQSDQLTITTGIPAQDEFSLAATKLNIEGFDNDGETTVLTARMGDHFHNPVPDGTAVNFTTEGGVVQGSCTTVGGACSSTLTSQALRPTNGRVTVLAYAIGEEAFVDLNGNGLADLGELFDARGPLFPSDLGDIFVDYNESGLRDAATEPFIPFVPGSAFSAAGDAKYNGILCNEAVGLGGGTPSAAGTCSGKLIFVRRSHVIVFSGSTAFLTRAPAVPGSIALGVCADGVPFVNTLVSFTFFIHDVNTNTMPVGTSIAFSATNGTITSLPTSFVVPNNIGCVAPGAGGCPATAPALAPFTVIMKSDATQAMAGAPPVLTCTNPSKSGSLNITVTTPGAVVGPLTTFFSIPVTD